MDYSWVGNIPFMADATLMALYAAVRLVVGRQAGVPGERLAAHRADKALLVGVRAHVFQQPERLREALVALLTDEGLLARVGA